MKQCKNCHANFEGLYCPQCGQKIFNRFDFRYVIEELQNLLELDRGIFNNFKKLLFLNLAKSLMITYMEKQNLIILLYRIFYFQ